MKLARQIPNIITLTNLFFGCLAIVYIFYDHITIEVAADSYFFDGRLNYDRLHFGKLHIAGILVIIAALLDFIDGIIARFLKVNSSMGKQLDSLADMVTFGLVPGLIMYYLLAISMFDTKMAFSLGIATFLPGFIITIASAWRLAKYNVTEGDRKFFSGLPVPVMALFIASLPLVLFFNEGNLQELVKNPIFLYSVIVVLSILMVSKFRMYDLKLSRSNPGTRTFTIIFVTYIAVLLLAGLLFLNLFFALIPALITSYIVVSLIANKVKT